MTDFEVLIQSLGEHAVDYIGEHHLRQLTIFSDEHTASAEVQIFLEANDWNSQSRAIDKMIELRKMFLDELSLSYRFLDEDQTMQAAAERSSYAYA